MTDDPNLMPSRGEGRDAMGNPFEVLDSRDVYANPWIAVREDRVRRPDGTDGIYGVVTFRSQALGAVVLFSDRTTMLVGQYRYPLGRWLWEIPAGGGSFERDPTDEMARELKEETGLVARRWTPLGGLHHSTSVTDERAMLWLARDLETGAAEPEATEVLGTWRLPFAEAVAMAEDGRLTDAMTVAALLRADRLLAQELT